MMLCPACGAAYREPARVCAREGEVLQPAADLDWRIGSQVGNYRLLDLLGRGGMGAVYRAEHVYIEKPAAIKILHEQMAAVPGAVERFLREARAAASIGHPNIVEISDCGETHDGLTYLVMEHVEGRALDELLELGRLSLMRAINIANQIGRGLRAAHDQGIVHRDLKPANVMLQRRAGRRDIVQRQRPRADAERYAVRRENSYDFVKILDFGAATFREPDQMGGDPSEGLLGTPHYMAPEAVRGGPIDQRFDIYALGVILYEMLTGCAPFDGESSVEIVMAHAERPVPPMREKNPAAEVSDAAERLVQRALAKRPDDRPQTMDELLRELQRCYGDEAFLCSVETQMPAAFQAGVRPRPRRLTEELKELFAKGGGSDVLERALSDDPKDD